VFDFDKHSTLFQIIILALLLFVGVITSLTFYTYVSSPTDENWFADPPSRLYVSQSIPAFREGSLFRRTAMPQTPDSVLVGDLVVKFAKKRVSAAADVKQVLSASRDSQIVIEVFRPSLNQGIDYVVRRTDLPADFLRDIQNNAYVYDVIEGGASDRAGMRVGDLILRVNGKEFNSAVEADVILRQGQIGRSLTYEVLRGNQLIPLHVTLARFGISFCLLVLCLSGLTYVVFGSILALARPRIKAARMLGLGFILVGYFVSILLIRRDVGTNAFTIIRNISLLASAYLGLAVLARSAHYFPQEIPAVLAKKWIPALLYGIAAAGFLFDVFRVIPSINLLGAVLLSIAANVVTFIYRKQRSDEYRRMDRVIRWTIYAVVALSVGIVALVGVYRLNGNEIGYVGFPFMLLPLAFLYTIGRYRLLDMNIRLRRNIQYTLITTAWFLIVGTIFFNILILLPSRDLPLPSIVITGASIEVTDTPMRPENRELVQRLGFIALAFVVTYVFWKGAKVGQRIIDAKYFRTQFDHRRASSEIAEVMSSTLSMVELGRAIAEKLAALMRLKRSGVLLFRDESECCCQEVFGFDGAAWKNFCAASGTILVNELRRFKGETRVDYLPEETREPFVREGFQYLIPIKSKEKLIGAFFVGEKLSESTFRQEDFAFLASVAMQASVSIENAFLYEELAEKERLKHELEIARRIQLASLPQTTPVIEGLDLAGISNPAFEVGGDFFDYLVRGPSSVMVIIGDVSGKGTSAALYMSKVQGILRSLHEFQLSPADLFTRANRLLYQDLEKRSFVTVLGAEFDTTSRSVVTARAGHLPLYRYSAREKKIESVMQRGLGIGLEDRGLFNAELKEFRLQYDPDDVLVFVTDGVTEAHNLHGELFGDERVNAVVRDNAGKSAVEIRDAILAAVHGFAGGAPQHDDETVVIVKALR